MIAFFIIAESNSVVFMFHVSLIHLFVDGHLVWLHFLNVDNKRAMDTDMQVPRSQVYYVIWQFFWGISRLMSTVD